jgi:hypothetical protein
MKTVVQDLSHEGNKLLLEMYRLVEEAMKTVDPEPATKGSLMWNTERYLFGEHDGSMETVRAQDQE